MSEAGCVTVTFGGPSTVVRFVGTLDDSCCDAVAEAFSTLPLTGQPVRVEDYGLSLVTREGAYAVGRAVARLVEVGMDVHVSLCFRPLITLLKASWPELFELAPAEPEPLEAAGGGESQDDWRADTAVIGASSVAREMRLDIATALEEGMLPRQWSYSVRQTPSASTPRIDIVVEDCEDAWATGEADNVGYQLTEEAEVACMTLHRIHEHQIGKASRRGRNYAGAVSVAPPRRQLTT